MKTLEELKAFAEGYLEATNANGGLVFYADDWVVWGGYDINLVGGNYTPFIDDEKQLKVHAYPAGWGHTLPDPIHSFTTGESK